MLFYVILNPSEDAYVWLSGRLLAFYLGLDYYLRGRLCSRYEALFLCCLGTVVIVSCIRPHVLGTFSVL